MSCFSGPEIQNSGLVFAYDMNNTKKSWKGRPITNQFTLPTPDGSNNVTFPLNGTGTFQRIYSGTYDGYAITSSDIVYRYDLGVAGCHYHGNQTTITAGQTATFSFDYYVSPDAANYPTLNYLANFEGAVSASATDPTPTIKGVWKRASFTATAAATGSFNMLLYPGACSSSYLASSGFILYKNPQIEFDAPGNVSSPFVSTTRTNTQALLDFTNTNTITATSLTYASDGTFSFNGSSNYASVADSSSLQVADTFSISAWIYPTILNNRFGIFSTRTANDTGSWQLEVGVGSGGQNRVLVTGVGTWIWESSNDVISANQWCNICFVKPNNATQGGTMYVNGVSLTPSTTTAYTILNNSNSKTIGVGTNLVQYFPGNIGNIQLHNQALTATEVQQNFNALRGRYNV